MIDLRPHDLSVANEGEEMTVDEIIDKLVVNKKFLKWADKIREEAIKRVKKERNEKDNG